MKKCSIDGCDKNVSARGLCKNHYMLAYKRGEFDVIRRKSQNTNPPEYCQAEGCEKKHYSLGYCNAHYTRLRRHGSPHGGGTPQGEPLEWICSHVNHESNECLAWPYAKARGYGIVAFNGRQRVASNLMCELANGKSPKGKPEAAHTCGKGHLGCVNPRHLYWASHKENHQDKKSHGTLLKGEGHPMCRLTESDVLYIRSQKGAIRADDLAEKFSVSRSHIYLIWARKLWRHI
jgi:hypothetical protein